MTNVDDFLAHYGVKGMKWGVRRAASGAATAGRAAGAGIKKASFAAGGSVKEAIRKSREKRAATKAERDENTRKASEAGYSAKMRAQDLQDVGRGGVRRIEKRIAEGGKVGTSRFKESIATTARGFAVGTAILAAPIALAATDRGLANLAQNINAKRGAEVARNLFADNKGLTSYSTVALAFDPTKGTWN